MVPTRSTAVLYQGRGIKEGGDPSHVPATPAVRHRGAAEPGAAGRSTAALAGAPRLAPRLAARAAEHDRAGTFPADDFADLRAAGLFGLMVPPRLGGPGAGFADYAGWRMALAPAATARPRWSSTCTPR